MILEHDPDRILRQAQQHAWSTLLLVARRNWLTMRSEVRLHSSSVSAAYTWASAPHKLV